MSEPDGAEQERRAWSVILAAASERRHLSVAPARGRLLVTSTATDGSADVRFFAAPDTGGVRDLLRAVGAEGV